MRRTTWSVGAVAVALAAALVMSGGAGPAEAATSYPSWGDVQAAKANAAATQTQVDRINGLLAALQSASNAASELAVKRAGEYGLAELSLQKATTKATDLQTRADAAAGEAATLRCTERQTGRADGSRGRVRLLAEALPHERRLEHREQPALPARSGRQAGRQREQDFSPLPTSRRTWPTRSALRPRQRRRSGTSSLPTPRRHWRQRRPPRLRRKRNWPVSRSMRRRSTRSSRC